MNFKLTFAALLAAAALAPAQAAITVHTGAFLGSVTHYNGFEGIGATSSYPGSTTPYTEDTITVEYVGTLSYGGIWTNSQIMEGALSWYENGGGQGYTDVTFGPTNAIQFAAGSGYGGASPHLQYEVLSSGVVIATGEIAGISSYKGFGYYGFSGATFDEIHLQVQSSSGIFGAGAYEAGAYDAFSIGTPVPEPSSWALMVVGVGVLGVALRRRQGAKA